MFVKERIINTFIEYVKIGSETGNEKEFYERIIKDLKSIGAEVSVDDAGKTNNSNANNIYAKIPGIKDIQPLMFGCHMDTVKPGIGIKPVRVDGMIKSSGDTVLGSDDKSGITALIEALKIVKNKNVKHGPLEIIFTISEEGGLKGSKSLDYSRIISKKCFVLDSSGPVGKIVVQAPAQNEIKAVITGKSAHAGLTPEKGISAIMVGAEAITNMKLLRIDEETTANIGTFEAVGETNIVSKKAKIIGEIRSLKQDKIQKQTEHMKKCFKNAANKYGAEMDIKVEKKYDAFNIDENDEVVKYVKNKCRLIGIEAFTTYTGGGSDANIYNSKGIKTLNLGCGVNHAHSTKESIAEKDIVDLTKLAYYLMLG